MERRQAAVRKVRYKLEAVVQVTGPWVSCSSRGEDLLGTRACRDVPMCTRTLTQPRGPWDLCAWRLKEVGKEGQFQGVWGLGTPGKWRCLWEGTPVFRLN